MFERSHCNRAPLENAWRWLYKCTNEGVCKKGGRSSRRFFFYCRKLLIFVNARYSTTTTQLSWTTRLLCMHHTFFLYIGALAFFFFFFISCFHNHVNSLSYWCVVGFFLLAWLIGLGYFFNHSMSPPSLLFRDPAYRCKTCTLFVLSLVKKLRLVRGKEAECCHGNG